MIILHFKVPLIRNFFSVRSFPGSSRFRFCCSALWARWNWKISLYYNNSEETEKAYITFVCFLFLFCFVLFCFLLRERQKLRPGKSETIVIPSASRLKMLKGSGDEGKKNVLMNRFLNMRKYNKLNKDLFDFWNRKSPLCTLFYEIQTCQVCVFIQTGYKLHFMRLHWGLNLLNELFLFWAFFDLRHWQKM